MQNIWLFCEAENGMFVGPTGVSVYFLISSFIGKGRSSMNVNSERVSFVHNWNLFKYQKLEYSSYLYLSVTKIDFYNCLQRILIKKVENHFQK